METPSKASEGHMEEMDQTVKGALDTILWFEDSLTEVEAKTGELFHMLERQNIDPEPLYEIFKVYSQIRFHMAEAHEYQALLNNRQSKKYARRGAVEPNSERLLGSMLNGQAPQSRMPLHKRLESKLISLLRMPLLRARRLPPQPEQRSLV
ncbi:MAG: hypothetical protein O7B79_09430 [SAR324 cluster bacterium]|nr:hypothetical protein [SAR324 cluster bacterium]